MFIIYDDFGYLKKANFEGLKDELFQELKGDIIESTDFSETTNIDILKNDLELIEKMFKTNNITFVIQELNAFGVHVVYSADIYQNINVLKHYYLSCGKQELAEKEKDVEQLENLIEKMLGCEK